MALVKCPDCESYVSTTAKKCSTCGAPSPERAAWVASLMWRIPLLLAGSAVLWFWSGSLLAITVLVIGGLLHIPVFLLLDRPGG